MSSIFSRSKRQSQPTRARGHSTASATSETASSAERSVSSKSLHATFCSRLVKLNDDELAAIALNTKLNIDWHSVMKSPRVGPARWRRIPQPGDFAVYTRQESPRYAVLAVGMVPGCVAEILNVLQSHNSVQYAQQMEGIFEDQFREGSFVHRVDVANERLGDRTCHHDGATLADLSVKTVTFNKTGWLSHHEEWCYLDAVYRHDNQTAEKVFTTMRPTDIVTGLSESKTKYFHDLVCGYLLRPGVDDAPSNHNGAAPSPRVTRVTFYAEYQTPKQFAFPLSSSRRHSLAASDKTIKQRLVKLAESTVRLTALVRRQRLGVQVLIDGNRFLPPINAQCNVCTHVVLIAKQCRLCGHAVCNDCSDLHERARQSRTSEAIDVQDIRVCMQCLHRVDTAEYANLSSSSLLGPAVVPDPINARPAAAVLKALLQDALFAAPSSTRRACVLSVIKCVLDQEETDSKVSRSSTASSSTPVLLTPTSSDRDVLAALDYLEVDPHVDLRSDDHRIYQLDVAGSSTAVPTPVPDTEPTRLEAVARVSVTNLQSSAELEILCDVAAKEMGCATSAISIIDSDTYHVVASNAPELRRVALPRESSMCSHTIMEKSPLIVKHPEADVRFSKFDSVDAFGVRYYCAFPLMGENDQIIGAMCCINSVSMDITASQFAAFKKLTTTASKIVRLQAKRRRSSDERVAASA